jgi:hypothetical protein
MNRDACACISRDLWIGVIWRGGNNYVLLIVANCYVRLRYVCETV